VVSAASIDFAYFVNQAADSRRCRAGPFPSDECRHAFFRLFPPFVRAVAKFRHESFSIFNSGLAARPFRSNSLAPVSVMRTSSLHAHAQIFLLM